MPSARLNWQDSSLEEPNTKPTPPATVQVSEPTFMPDFDCADGEIAAATNSRLAEAAKIRFNMRRLLQKRTSVCRSADPTALRPQDCTLRKTARVRLEADQQNACGAAVARR